MRADVAGAIARSNHAGYRLDQGAGLIKRGGIYLGRLRYVLLFAGLGVAVANLVIGIAQLRATNRRASGVAVNLDPEVIRAARTIAWQLTDTQSA